MAAPAAVWLHDDVRHRPRLGTARRWRLGACAAAVLALGVPAAAVPSTPDAAPPARVAAVPRLDLQALVDAAIDDDRRVLTLPDGRFRVTEPVWVAGARDLTIEATGTTLVWTLAAAADAPSAYALTFTDTRDVTLRGLRMDFDPLPYTQGRIVRVDRAAGVVDVRVDPGYRTDAAYLRADNDADGLHLHVFGDDGVLARGDDFVFADDVDLVDGVLRFRAPGQNLSAYRTGRRIATGAWRICGIDLTASRGFEADGVTVLSSGGAALLEHDSWGGSRLDLRVVPGPPPTPGAPPRLWSSTRDAYHAGDLRRGSVIHDSRFDAVGDDMVSVFSSAVRVLRVRRGSRPAVVVRGAYRGASAMLRPGDRAVVLRPASYRRVGVASVRSVAYRERTSRILLDGGRVRRGDLITFPDLAGAGAVVRDSTFTRGVSTAVTLKVEDGRVVGNDIAHFGQPGVVLGPDFGSLEADSPRRVTVARNRVRDVGRSAISRDGDYGFGAGIVVGVQDTPDAPRRLRGTRTIRDVRIVGNRVAAVPAWGLLVSNAVGVTVAGNRLVRTNRLRPTGEGRFWGLRPREAVMVRDAADVVLVGNRVLRPGRFLRRLVAVDPTADEATVDVSGIVRGR